MSRSTPWKTGNNGQDPSKQSKRSYETIDLTGSDDEEQPSKTPRLNNRPLLRTPLSSSSHVHSSRPPQSSQPTPSRGQWRRPSPPPTQSLDAPPSAVQPHTPSLTQRTVPSPSRNQYRTPHWTSFGAEVSHSLAERESWLRPSQSQADEGDIYDNIASTQNHVVGSEDFLKYGELPTKIVGVRYYQGFATWGEHVEVLREPSNPYDSNGSYAQTSQLPTR